MPKRFAKPVIAVVILAIFLTGSYLVQSVRSPQSDTTSGHSIVARTDLEIYGSTGLARVIDVQRLEQATGGLLFGIAHANGAVNVGAQLELIDLTSPEPGETPPGGIASIVATYENLGPNALIDVFFRVVQLEYTSGAEPGPELDNSDRGGTGVGAEIDASLPGGVLLPGETFDATFDILLPTIESFNFRVDVFGVLAPVNIVDRLDLEGLSTSYDPSPVAGAPAGVYTVTATFTNNSDEPLSYVFFDAVILTGGNLILNADGGPAGVGAKVSVPGTVAFGESFDVDFEIGLQARSPFEFFVDTFGIIGP